MKTLTLVIAFAALAAAQKPLKGGKHKPAYIATSPGSGLHGGESSPYQASAPQHAPQSHHGSYGGGGSPSYSSGIGKTSAKATYPLLLSDTRTLNTDGTINFNYQADNGLHQGETVDKDGTRRGFYSYPGADGKLITVKYTAGKNGFVAEGDHLPTQPQSAPYSPKQDSNDNYSPQQGSHGGHHGGQSSGFGGGGGGYSSHSPAPQHHSGAYRPSHHGGHSGGGSALGIGAGSGGNHFSHSSGGGGGGGHRGGNLPSFPQFTNHYEATFGGLGGSSGFGGGSGGGGGASPSYSGHQGGGGGGGGGSPSYSGHQGAPAGGHAHHGGASLSGHGGSSSFLQGLGSSGHGGGSIPDISSLGSSYSGPMFTASNPYQPHTTGPVNAGFDLGNGGQFTINFAPGVGQE
ncbi:hypothetical protein Ocin01_05853 [Orchesella cincta]|uniref:Endocuticle structural glycoprotein SgAbd-2 n=1 Tax=Orchesella cincta TaxID=48709 RepID=A0A1D2N6E9_ORCCI|nr:hypothetical protein Ocin01_05853 [Orchesella cincta]